jgi:hypothetical protein
MAFDVILIHEVSGGAGNGHDNKDSAVKKQAQESRDEISL